MGMVGNCPPLYKREHIDDSHATPQDQSSERKQVEWTENHRGEGTRPTQRLQARPLRLETRPALARNPAPLKIQREELDRHPPTPQGPGRSHPGGRGRPRRLAPSSCLRPRLNRRKLRPGMGNGQRPGPLDRSARRPSRPTHRAPDHRPRHRRARSETLRSRLPLAARTLARARTRHRAPRHSPRRRAGQRRRPPPGRRRQATEDRPDAWVLVPLLERGGRAG